MLTDSELFTSAFISYVFLYQNQYSRLPNLPVFNRIKCFELPGEVFVIKLDPEISWEKIELRDDVHGFIIKNVGAMNKSEFRVIHYERYTEIRFQNYTNRFRIEENTQVYFAELESSDKVKIETERYPKTKYTFEFS